VNHILVLEKESALKRLALTLKIAKLISVQQTDFVNSAINTMQMALNMTVTMLKPSSQSQVQLA
jgi:hypothetical protein